MTVQVKNPSLPSGEFLTAVGEGVAHVTDGPKVVITTPAAPAPAPTPPPAPAAPSVTVNVPR